VENRSWFERVISLRDERLELAGEPPPADDDNVDSMFAVS
jgi:hypothetical protein